MSYQSDYSGAQVEEAVGKALNPDAAPTEGSDNLVQSGGVASAVSDATELKVGDSIQYSAAMLIGFSSANGTILTIPVITTKRIPAGVVLTATDVQVGWIRGNGSSYTASNVRGEIGISSQNSYALNILPVSLPQMQTYAAYVSYKLNVVSA